MWTVLLSRKNQVIILGLVLLLTSFVGCSRPLGQRARYFPGGEVVSVGHSYLDFKVTGTACHQDPQKAMNAAKSTARFNLRSVTGSKRYNVYFRELDRYEEAGQVCVEMLAGATQYAE